MTIAAHLADLDACTRAMLVRTDSKIGPSRPTEKPKNFVGSNLAPAVTNTVSFRRAVDSRNARS